MISSHALAKLMRSVVAEFLPLEHETVTPGFTPAGINCVEMKQPPSTPCVRGFDNTPNIITIIGTAREVTDSDRYIPISE